MRVSRISVSWAVSSLCLTQSLVHILSPWLLVPLLRVAEQEDLAPDALLDGAAESLVPPVRSRSGPRSPVSTSAGVSLLAENTMLRLRAG